VIVVECLDGVPNVPGINPEFFITAIPRLVEDEGKGCGEITVIFCGDEYLLSMNMEFLNHNYYTDVITFDYSENQIVSGDIFVSIDRVIDNATSLIQPLEQEICRVVFHGVLHLLGYDDKSDDTKAVMTNKENEYINKCLLKK